MGDLCSETKCAEYRDELECRVQDLEAKLRDANLQVQDLRATVKAEALRAVMLDTVHKVALRQNDAMLDLAEHYTGSLWPEEVNRAAAEILKVGRAASDKPTETERLVGQYRKALEYIASCDDCDVCECADHAKATLGEKPKCGLNSINPTNGFRACTESVPCPVHGEKAKGNH